MQTGTLALVTLLLIAISWFELQLQDEWCKSTRHYVASILVIVVINIALTATAITFMFGSLVGSSTLVLLFASMGFPLWSGIRKIPQIKERNNVLDRAQNMIENYRGNNG